MFMTDAKLSEVLSADFAALLLPDGPQSIATLARDPHAKRLVKAFVETDKPVAVLGHAVSLLQVAEVASGRTVAGAEATREAVTIEGGTTWSEEPLVIDSNLITTANGSELPQVLATLVTKAGVPEPEVDQAA